MLHLLRVQLDCLDARRAKLQVSNNVCRYPLHAARLRTSCVTRLQSCCLKPVSAARWLSSQSVTPHWVLKLRVFTDCASALAAETLGYLRQRRSCQHGLWQVALAVQERELGGCD